MVGGNGRGYYIGLFLSKMPVVGYNKNALRTAIVWCVGRMWVVLMGNDTVTL